MRCAAMIVFALVALVLSACAGRKAEPWMLPKYGTPAPRYTPIPPLGERMSTNGRVFIVAKLDPKDRAAARALWTDSTFQEALSIAGHGKLLNDPAVDGVAWDVPRATVGDGYFAYLDGHEYDRDVPFVLIEDLMDWLERVRTLSIDETYADRRLRARGDMPGMQELTVHATRMISLGNHERAMESLMRAYNLRNPSTVYDEFPLYMLMRQLGLAYPPAKEQLRKLATEGAHAWNPDSFKRVGRPHETGSRREDPPSSDQMGMLRFAQLCVAADRLDILESRLAECQSDTSGDNERVWLLTTAAEVYAGSGFMDIDRNADLFALGGRLDPDPKASVVQAIQRPLAWLMLSDAPRESTLRQLGPELAVAGFTVGVTWCRCQAAGRRAEAREILQLFVESLNYPRAIGGFLDAGVLFGYLPEQTDKWLARKDLEQARRDRLRQGVELLRHQPQIVPTPE